MKTLTSPMGWNSWDCYGAAVTEETVKQNADFMAKNLKKFGWEYIVVDIQWSEPTAVSNDYNPFADLCMDEYGRLIPAPNRFPSSENGNGFKPLADYVHSLGLKFGIHIMRGIPRQAVHKNLPVKGTKYTAREIAKTASICCWNSDMYGIDPQKEGSRAYYDSIFELYASWGVDFIKCDDICRELPHEEQELIMLSESLRNCGRDMVLSLSPGPALLEKAELYKQVADMWRITDDFWDRWDLLYNMFERAEKWCTHTGGGNWPDADMLPIGPVRQVYDKNEWTHFSEDEQITMMTLWCVFRAPLMIGGEMTGFDDFTMKLITNESILNMHKNIRHSHQVYKRSTNGCEFIVWTGVDAIEGQYIAVFNTGDCDGTHTLCLSDLDIFDTVSGYELWSGNKITSTETMDVVLRKHEAKVYLIKKAV